MFDRWQRNLDGWALNKEEKIDFIKKITKFKPYYKKCHKASCNNSVVNKPNRIYCAEHYQELLKTTRPFSEPLLLTLLLDLEAGD